MVQTIVVREFMADRMAMETGFLPDCLIPEPPGTIGTRLHRNGCTDSVAFIRFRARVRTLLDTALPMDADTREFKPDMLALSPDARAQMIDFAD